MTNKELANKIESVVSNWNVPSISTKENLWQEVCKGIETNDAQLRHTKVQVLRYAVAASVLLLAFAVATIYFSNVTIKNGSSKILTTTLPDDSQIKLHSKSSISYNAALWFFQRKVHLKGEGFFKVTKGATFRVHTPVATVSVLGTSFTISTNPNHFKVRCYTGKVAVHTSSNSVVLTRGQQAFIKATGSNELAVKNENTDVLMPTWAGEPFTYSDEKLAIVLNDIEQVYGITFISSKNIKKLSFTGQWNSSMPLNEVLKIVCLPFDLQASKIDKTRYTIHTID